MTDDKWTEYARTPEGNARLKSILAAIPDVESMTLQEIYEYVVAAIRAYQAKLQ